MNIQLHFMYKKLWPLEQGTKEEEVISLQEQKRKKEEIFPYA
jgi:hypothetical protein